MHLMYLGNTDVVSAQMSKVHSHYGSSCMLSATIHVAIPWQSNIIFGESKTNVSTFDMLSSAHQLGR